MKRVERLAGLRAGHTGKVVSAAEALQMVRDGDAVASSGFVGIGQNAEKVVFLGSFSAGGTPKFVAEVEQRLAPLGHKVWGVVNYDHVTLDPQAEDEWAAMVSVLVDRHYIDVARYTTSGFLRAKLGPALAARGVAPHIYETAAEAQRAVRSDG